MRKIVSLVVLLIAVVACLEASSSPKTYKVKKGQFLKWIAQQQNVSWEAMLLANESFLANKYKEVCDDLSGNFRRRDSNRGSRKGGLYYCNDNYVRPYGNTLRPGWTLNIPSESSPTSINQTVSEIKGDKIALVIDDTGSMNDDRQQVSEFYLAAIRQYGKHLSGVWLYSNGRVRKYEAGGVHFYTSGDRENTFGALREAAKEKPDAIILVTDEPGDDWQWGEVHNLPPVIGHCLDQSFCAENLQRLARETHGRYVFEAK